MKAFLNCMQYNKNNNKIMKKGFLDSISPFSLILVMVILMIIGVAMIPLIKISYMPTSKGVVNSLNISFGWSGASPRVIEQEVTSKIEGLVSSVNGVESVNSVSYSGYGMITAQLKKGVNASAVRFEISSLLKQIASRLPEGVGYPSLSESGVGGVKGTSKILLSYQVNADMEEAQIEDYAEKSIKPHIEQIEGVKSVNISGATPKYIELTYDPLLLNSYGLSASDITEGIRNFLGTTSIIGDVEKSDEQGEKSRITLLLTTSRVESDVAKIPITKRDDKMVYLGNVTTIEYKDRVPSSYYRINGLKTIYFSIEVEADANLITLSDEVQAKMEEVKANLIDNYYVTLTYDAAKEIKTELYKLLRRTVLSLAILLLFVWIVNRNVRYLAIIAVTLLANILISFILYYIFNIELHIYSLAGIAVSFGLIIDTSIVMVDHYSYYRDRRVFIAILAAMLTTMGSLVIIFFMPDYIKKDLYDFASIVIVNLAVALLISLLFVPAIISKSSLVSHQTKKKISWRRKIAKFSRIYSKYISFTQKKKWIYIIIFILAFGVPVHLLPPRIGVDYYRPDVERKEPKWYEDLYNKTIGGNFYQATLKRPLEQTLGGTMRLFSSSLSSYSFSRTEEAPVLTISANMPEGSTIGQMNEVITKMENFLSKYDEISKYETRIGNEGGTITVEFKEEAQQTSFPMYLSNLSKSQAINIGGADWSIYGIDQQGFSNALNLDRKSHRISISGYNYDRLYKYAENLTEAIKVNKRVTDVDIETESREYYNRGSGSLNEIYMKYEMDKVALYNINLGACYSALGSLLSSSDVGTYRTDKSTLDMKLVSVHSDKFDLWNLQNSYITVGDRQIRYSQLGEIGKRKAKSSISKKNQEYSMDVAFNFMGSYESSDRFMKATIEKLNNTLPIGFKCANSSYGWYDDRGEQYWLILLIVTIIFFMCSILFESLRQPLVIISLIPLSFMGTFMTFYFSGINFGTGGFASLVLLSGLVVNAAIYIINEYNNFGRSLGGRIGKVRLYVKAFNHKIIPVLLTVLSTVLGLIPFLMDGKEEQFWFSFAIGTTGGLLFSLFALVFILPILFPLKINRKNG